MLDGKWCLACNDVAEEACAEGTCQVFEEETHVDLESLHHEPSNVDWGGGD